MTADVHPYLRYLASWDRDEAGFHAALDSLALRPVRFSGVPRRHDDEAASLAAFVVDPMAAVTEAPDGTLLLPGNPHQVLRELVEERTALPRRPRWHRIPRTVRQSIASTRRVFRGRQGSLNLRPPRPGEGLAWPDEPRVDRYRRALYEGLVEERFRPGGARGAAGTHRHRAELLSAPWPGRTRYAVAVTYEVVSGDGLRQMGAVLEEDLARGVRPCFYLAPRRGLWEASGLEAVREGGGELGLFGLTPDADAAFSRTRRLQHALERVTPWLEQHDVVGHRNPSALVTTALLGTISSRFEYDSSVPDTVLCPVSGTRRGCAVTTPFWREALLELPITVPTEAQLRDHGVVGLEYLELIRAKIRSVAERFGLAMLSIRLEPGRGGSRVQRDLLGAVLEELRDEGGAWFALPREIASLWREAAAIPDIHPAAPAAAGGTDHRL